jgi:hypothetical protein
MNPSGGLRWHWKAWRSQGLWEPTCQDIATWLAEKPAQRSELLLIGASAGWMMSSAWLAGFRKVTTYDIDPLAGPLFRWRHGKSLTASGTVLLCERGDALNQLGEVLQAHRQALVLFDNVLGQIRFHHPDVDEASHRIASIRRRLRGRHWGSIHDAYSGPVRTPVSRRAHTPMMRSEQPPYPTASARKRDQQDAPQRAAFAAFGSQLDADGAWLDHLTGDLFPPGTHVSQIAWPHLDDYCHWLQAAWVEPQ